ncbi:MAG TPA: septum site-determining protein Ssd [Mycobacterium sp.]|nr:septum site-determining protein Ssd [Mycobacterium sp.]
MKTRAAILALLSEPGLRDEVERVAAAADLGVVQLAGGKVPKANAWQSSGAVVLDEFSARNCASRGLPRRSAVFLVSAEDTDRPCTATFQAAIAIGASGVYTLPAQSADLVAALASVGDVAGDSGHGAVIAVLGGRGGAGASLFSAALALSSGPGLLADLDTWGGGIDLLVGVETAAGLRWPDIAVRGGRLEWPAVRDALPRCRGVSVLSGNRLPQQLAVSAVGAVVDAGRRAGVTVVCDLPRHISEVTEAAIASADLLVLVSCCDVRSAAATAATANAVAALNPSAGLVVRGPAPGGLRASDVADSVGLPLLAAMRPEPMVAERLERGGLRLTRRSPLAAAAADVLGVMRLHPAGRVVGAG